MRWLPLLLFVASWGCQPSPYCGLPADATGRLVAYCDNPRREPVCDLPEMMAHFEDSGRGLVLVGGERARCDATDEVACPPRTVGEPYCITDPEL